MRIVCQYMYLLRDDMRQQQRNVNPFKSSRVAVGKRQSFSFDCHSQMIESRVSNVYCRLHTKEMPNILVHAWKSACKYGRIMELCSSSEEANCFRAKSLKLLVITVRYMSILTANEELEFHIRHVGKRLKFIYSFLKLICRVPSSLSLYSTYTSPVRRLLFLALTHPHYYVISMAYCFVFVFPIDRIICTFPTKHYFPQHIYLPHTRM